MSNTEKKEAKKEKKATKKKKPDANQKLKDEIKSLKDAVKTAIESAEEEKKNALIHLADLENFKKRKNQEVDNFKKYAAESTVTEFLTILDNFYIASAHIDKDQADDTVKGFLMIQKQIESTLEKLNVKKIDSLNKPFDTNFHQAIGQETKDGVEPNTVIKEMQAGYELNGRVIRPAMVVVSS